jgi:nitroimidazol reductase NimA-like FMN-containing flavoprotein (pyridoxamine 5'-phosphate oxidase superfamily)
MNEQIEKAKKLIGEIPYITIASITPDGNPWNSPVFAVPDEKYNFIWNSSMESQHSKNISANGNIFIVIYNSTVHEGQGFGVYIEAEAKEINNEKERENAVKIFYKKINKTPPAKTEFSEPSVRRMYIAMPKKVWVNQYQKGRIPPDWKEEIKLI